MEQNRRLHPFGGRRTWGSFDVYPSSYGIIRYRLVVFPPGMSPDERRLLLVWRSWPAWGTALFLVTQIWLAQTVTTGWASAIAAAVWLATGATSGALAGASRARVRTLIVLTMHGSHDKAAAARLNSLRDLTGVLLDADARRSAAELTEPEHEMICWQVYQQLARIDDPAIR